MPVCTTTGPFGTSGVGMDTPNGGPTLHVAFMTPTFPLPDSLASFLEGLFTGVATGLVLPVGWTTVAIAGTMVVVVYHPFRRLRAWPRCPLGRELGKFNFRSDTSVGGKVVRRCYGDGRVSTTL